MRSDIIGKFKNCSSLFSDRDSEDESSPFSTLHRHGSIGKDSDNDDSKRDVFHLHRLRSTRPKRTNLEHADSLSSGEEDDDEGFEILTAENLFSTLLSRVRDLTQRLNVEDGIRPGFPSSRFLSHFDHGTNFWNKMEPTLSRHSSLGRTFNRDRPITKTSTGSSFGVPWRRSVSKDLASDIDSVFKNTNTTNPRPTGDGSKNENLNLADLDLKKFGISEEDALALSYLTPGLSRRIQKQILAQLAPSEARKLHRTLSSRTSEEPLSQGFTSTLPRRYSVETSRAPSKDEIARPKESNLRMPRSFLPIKRDENKPSYEFNIRSSSIGSEPRCENRFNYKNPKVTKSLSVREPRSYSLAKTDIQSPESSISESFSLSNRNDSLESSSRCISDSSASRPYSKYSSDSLYSRYSPNRSSQSLVVSDIHKTDLKKPSNPRKVSRFLRPDFYDTPKEDSVFLKEKKDREMETQKVLKEIRDKRKIRLSSRRDRSGSREKQLENELIQDNVEKTDKEIIEESKDSSILNEAGGTKTLDHNVSSNHDYVNVSVPMKNCPVQPDNHTKLEGPSKHFHDYVNVKTAENSVPLVKKEKSSRIARPKSYPTENVVEDKRKDIPEKESKISRIRKGFTRQSKEKSKEDKNEANKFINEEEKGHKNKLLQSIEKKLEKFRSTKESEEMKVIQEQKSSVGSAIKRLREQSLPRNLEHCTESGLIKRAVSVEDLSGAKPLQASRKSVTKILGLFKKYEEQDNKKKVTKKNKNKSNKLGDKEGDKTTESVIKRIETDEVNSNFNENGMSPSSTSQSEMSEKKERPRSLLIDKMKQFRNGAKSDSVLNENESKGKSKLPVTSFRRSLNLDNLPEPPKFYKNPSRCNLTEDVDKKADRKHLRLDLSRIPHRHEPLISVDSVPSTSSHREDNSNENRNSFTTTDDSSTILSPSDDYMSCDSWSVSSDFHHVNDLQSPLSPNGHVYSGDENESVIDRIRRKSFYTRFNEKKRTRKPNPYKDLELGYKSLTDYSSLDRKNNDYRNPVTRRSSHASALQETSKTYRPYTRSSSLMGDYVNMPNRYQTYSSKIGRQISLYSDSEDNALDDLLSTANSRKYSSHIQASRLGRTSVSPVNEYFVDHSSSSVVPSTSSEHVQT